MTREEFIAMLRAVVHPDAREAVPELVADLDALFAAEREAAVKDMRRENAMLIEGLHDTQAAISRAAAEEREAIGRLVEKRCAEIALSAEREPNEEEWNDRHDDFWRLLEDIRGRGKAGA